MSKVNPNDELYAEVDEFIHKQDKEKILAKLKQHNQKLADKITAEFPQVDIVEVLALGFVANITEENLLKQIADKFNVHIIANYDLEM